jgi:two-component system, LytTR family, sensor kinase
MAKLWRTTAVVAIWLGLAVASATQASVALASRGTPAPYGGLLLDAVLDWGTCAVFTPLVLWLVARFPAVRRPLVHLPILVAAIAALVVAKYALHLELLALLTDRPPRSLGETLVRRFAGEAIAFGALFAVAHAVVLYDRLRTEEIRGLVLRAELADSRLDALVHKIEPHFLFNTLQAISTLLHRDPRAADAMITGLSELLRELMRGDAQREVPLAVELEIARRYLDIMAIRYGDRLSVAIEVPGEVGHALVPRLVLQPLIENALRHGVAANAGAGKLELTARRSGDRLAITVADDGPGTGAGAAGNGLGLATTRERLQRLYGGAARLETTAPATGGFQVVVELPFRPGT